MSLEVGFNLGTVYQRSNFQYPDQDKEYPRLPTNTLDYLFDSAQTESKTNTDLETLKAIAGFENVSKQSTTLMVVPAPDDPCTSTVSSYLPTLPEESQSLTASRYSRSSLSKIVRPTSSRILAPRPVVLVANAENFSSPKLLKGKRNSLSDTALAITPAAHTVRENRPNPKNNEHLWHPIRRYLCQPCGQTTTKDIPLSPNEKLRLGSLNIIREAQTLLALLGAIINTVLIPIHLHDWDTHSAIIGSMVLFWFVYILNRLPVPQKLCVPISILAIGGSVMALILVNYNDVLYNDISLPLLNSLAAIFISAFNYGLKRHLGICALFGLITMFFPLMRYDLNGTRLIYTLLHFVLVSVISSLTILVWRKQRQQVDEQVGRTIELQDQFLANSSHEVRTPLAGILGFLEIMLEDGNLELTEDQRQNLVMCNRSAKNMLVVVNDIVDFSKMEAGKFRLEEFDFEIRSLVSEILHIMAALADPPGRLELSCEVDQDVPRKFSGDAVRLRQIIVNLFGNGVKFTKEGSVRLKVSQNGDPVDNKVLLKFAVQDTGIGIKKEDVSRIFKRFAQADSSSTRRYGGSGLGLVICQKLTSLFEGDIGAISQEGRGSEFWFTANLLIIDTDASEIAPMNEKIVVQSKVNTPEMIARRQRVVKAQAEKLTSNRPCILVVDDVEVNRKIVTKLCESFGYFCVQAVHGGQAVDIFSERVHNFFAAILMDIQMPVKDGFVATQEIRAIEQKQNEQNTSNIRIPIIAFTANAFDRDQDICLRAGMDDYLSKPFTKASLQTVLQKWVKDNSEDNDTRGRGKSCPM